MRLMDSPVGAHLPLLLPLPLSPPEPALLPLLLQTVPVYEVV